MSPAEGRDGNRQLRPRSPARAAGALGLRSECGKTSSGARSMASWQRADQCADLRRAAASGTAAVLRRPQPYDNCGYNPALAAYGAYNPNLPPPYKRRIVRVGHPAGDRAGRPCWSATGGVLWLYRRQRPVPRPPTPRQAKPTPPVWSPPVVPAPACSGARPGLRAAGRPRVRAAADPPVVDPTRRTPCPPPEQTRSAMTASPATDAARSGAETPGWFSFRGRGFAATRAQGVVGNAGQRGNRHEDLSVLRRRRRRRRTCGVCGVFDRLDAVATYRPPPPRRRWRRRPGGGLTAAHGAERPGSPAPSSACRAATTPHRPATVHRSRGGRRPPDRATDPRSLSRCGKGSSCSLS